MPSESRTWELAEACRIFAREVPAHLAARRVLREAAQAGVIPWREAVAELTEAEADRLGQWIDGVMRVEASGDNITRLSFEVHTCIDRARVQLTQLGQPAEAVVWIRIALAAGERLASAAQRMERDAVAAVPSA